MKLLHFSDLHLGYRAFSKTMSGGAVGRALSVDGQNVREADVMRTFGVLIDRAIELAPDVIVIGGDTFHSPRPSNATIVGAFREFSRLMAALPKTAVVMVAGNHDLPKSRDTANILDLFRPLGIEVVDWEPRRLSFADLGLSVLAIPDAPGMARPSIEPDHAATYNVMLVHGEVQGMSRHFARGGAMSVAGEYSKDEISGSGWDYIAFGHYHVYRQIAPNCFYSGSTDYTSTNPWGEIAEQDAAGIAGKGFVTRDLETGAHTFHALPPSRRLLELPSFSAHELSAEDIDDAVRTAVDACPGGIDDQVVRIVVTDCPKEVARELDGRAIGGYKRRALNFNLIIRRPETVSLSTPRVVGQRKPLEDIIADFFIKRFSGNPDFSPEKMLALSDKYLQSADSLSNDLKASVATEGRETAAA